LLDFVGSSESIGKPSCNDLRLGLVTAPILFACQEDANIQILINRLKVKDFGSGSDSERLIVKDQLIKEAFSLTLQTKGLQKTKNLAGRYVDMASSSLKTFDPSPARDAIEGILASVITRTK
jgi:geranylgeranyl pyrophosphate synthase